MAYPKETLTYFDGNQFRQTDYLQKHEVLWGLSELDNYHLSASSSFPSLYDDAFTTLPAAEKERIIKDMAKQVIGKKFTMRYENYFNNNAVIEQEITSATHFIWAVFLSVPTAMNVVNCWRTIRLIRNFMQKLWLLMMYKVLKVSLNLRLRYSLLQVSHSLSLRLY